MKFSKKLCRISNYYRNWKRKIRIDRIADGNPVLLHRHNLFMNIWIKYKYLNRYRTIKISLPLTLMTCYGKLHLVEMFRVDDERNSQIQKSEWFREEIHKMRWGERESIRSGSIFQYLAYLKWKSNHLQSKTKFSKFTWFGFILHIRRLVSLKEYASSGLEQELYWIFNRLQSVPVSI